MLMRGAFGLSGQRQAERRPLGVRAGTAARVALLAVLLASGAGCSGYRFVRTSEGLGPVRRVAIQTLYNNSYEPGLDVLVTDALRREFQRRGGATLVSDPAQADLVLAGSVLELRTTARSFSSIAFALEYQMQMQIALVATRADGSAIVIDPNALYEWELYLTSADVEAERKNREEALRRLAAVLASRVRESLAERLARSQ
jgi:hypothetical protein